MVSKTLAGLRGGSHAKMRRIDQTRSGSGGTMRLQYVTKSHTGTWLTNVIVLCKDVAANREAGI